MSEAAVQPTTTTTNNTNTTHVEQTTLPKTNMFQRLSEWLWPQVTYDAFEYYENNHHDPTNNRTSITAKDGPRHIETLAGETCPGPRALPEQQQPQQENFSCRACRIRGIDCDRQRPHCSQCQDQQILCFFVAPLPRLTKKTKRAPSQQSVPVPPPPQAIRC